jgi:hypothetical protein
MESNEASTSPPGDQRPAAGYTVRLADLEEDRSVLLALWDQNLSHDAGRGASFDWYYRNNPYGAGRCWLLQDGAGNPIGVAGLGLRRIKVGDRTVLAGLASDFAVNSEHRFLQPALMLQKAVRSAVSEEMPVIYGVPNQRALGVLRRLGYRQTGDLVRYSRIIRTEPYLRRLRWIGPAAPLVSIPADLGIRLLGPENRAGSREYIGMELSGFDDRFDRLWERASDRFHVIGERTSKFLRWRYSACPRRQYFIIGLLARGDERLCGYAVCMQEERRVECVDLLTEDRGASIDGMLAALVRAARDRGAIVVFMGISGGKELEGSLGRLRFGERVRAAGVHPSQVMAVSHDSLGTWPGVDREWYFLPGDEDYN